MQATFERHTKVEKLKASTKDSLHFVRVNKVTFL